MHAIFGIVCCLAGLAVIVSTPRDPWQRWAKRMAVAAVLIGVGWWL